MGLRGLERLFEHMAWADRAAAEALLAAPAAAEALDLYAHVLGTELVWLARLAGRPPAAAVWPRVFLPECLDLARRAEEGYRAYLSALSVEDLGRCVAYTNSAGQAFESRIEDILWHVALHGAYHRGQIALLLRQAGERPAPTDFIAFVRGSPAATRHAKPG
jgi:uncharacterized damage-inducible protein DinB